MTTSLLFDVTDRLALITGSSRGIGYALARGLLHAGAKVVINGRDIGALSSAQTTLTEQTGRRPEVVSFDVTSAEEVTAGVSHIEERLGALDILVNNAGAQHREPITEFSLEDWNRLLTLNLTSAFLVGREAARHMVPRGRGKIVNICSVQSELVRPGIAPYSATKGGLKQLTKGMCADLGPYGIQVNGLGPGYFDTELTAALVADADFSAWVAKRTPAGRWGDVDDLVGGLIFLCSKASDFVNGQVLYIDGGMLSVL
jgi:gluconate 5-dehydrogenase